MIGSNEIQIIHKPNVRLTGRGSKGVGGRTMWGEQWGKKTNKNRV